MDPEEILRGTKVLADKTKSILREATFSEVMISIPILAFIAITIGFGLCLYAATTVS